MSQSRDNFLLAVNRNPDLILKEMSGTQHQFFIQSLIENTNPRAVEQLKAMCLVASDSNTGKVLRQALIEEAAENEKLKIKLELIQNEMKTLTTKTLINDEAGRDETEAWEEAQAYAKLGGNLVEILMQAEKKRREYEELDRIYKGVTSYFANEQLRNERMKGHGATEKLFKPSNAAPKSNIKTNDDQPKKTIPRKPQ